MPCFTKGFIFVSPDPEGRLKTIAILPRRSIAPASILSGMEIQKVDPWPTVLLTPMDPLRRLVSSLEIARPRPVPPCERVWEASTWRNFSKMSCCLSGAMPGPWSLTLIRMRLHQRGLRPAAPARGPGRRGRHGDEVDTRPRRGKLDRVGQEVVEDLLELSRIGPDDRHIRGNVDFQGHLFGLGQGLENVGKPLEQVGQRQRLGPYFHLARLDLGQVEQVVDQIEKGLSAEQDIADIAGGSRIGTGRRERNPSASRRSPGSNSTACAARG